MEEGQECLGTEIEKKDTVFKYCHIYLNVCVYVCVCVCVCVCMNKQGISEVLKK